MYPSQPTEWFMGQVGDGVRFGQQSRERTVWYGMAKKVVTSTLHIKEKLNKFTLISNRFEHRTSTPTSQKPSGSQPKDGAQGTWSTHGDSDLRQSQEFLFAA